MTDTPFPIDRVVLIWLRGAEDMPPVVSWPIDWPRRTRGVQFGHPTRSVQVLDEDEFDRVAASDKAEREASFRRVHELGHQRGMEAGLACVPTPMVVRGFEPVMDGMCGFAWVVVKPGNHPFARWLKREGLAETHWEGGVCIWVSEHDQSWERKRAHARAYAEFVGAMVDAAQVYHDSRAD
jgi:hypothetical protein